MYKKDRDNKILKFIEEHGSITINICANLFFNNANNKYDLARKRLRILYKNKYIKRNKEVGAEVIYYLNRPLKPHNLKLLEVYSRLCTIGNVITFEKEKMVLCPNKKRKIDGFMEIEIDDGEYINTYPVIIEIDYTHNTHIDKIKDVYNSNYFQNQYGFLPSILIVKKNEWDKKLNGYEDITIINLNWNLDNIEEVFN
ncbi:hypothetical protein GCM10008908_09460 [Clostridium subterminale]|uniref:Replication-relaxation n=1 Tax=Clostridium subterminale TaxID=1550 RepID=A0ABN1KK45_CLOSU